MDSMFKSLDANKTLKDSLPIIIEAFVSFYGEENREFITDRFNNTLIIAYQDESTLGIIMSRIKENKRNEILKDVFNKSGLEYNNENIELYLSYESNFVGPVCNRYCPILAIYEYIDSIKNGDLVKPNNEIKFLKKFDSNITEENVVDLIKEGKLDKLYEISKIFNEGNKKYNEFVDKKLKQYNEIYEKLDKLHRDINKKYYMEFVKEFISLSNPSDQEKIEQQLKENQIVTYRVPAYEIIYGISLDTTNGFSYFSKDCDLELEDKEVNDFRKDIIKKNRISYFKYKGIDLGQDYNEYVNNEECKKIWPSEELVNKFNERLNYYKNQADIEYYTGLDSYKDAIKRMKDSNLLYPGKHLQPFNFKKRLKSADADIVLKDGKFELKPVVLIYADDSEYSDVNLIHELNHVYELSLLNVDKDKYECVCGWDYVSYDLTGNDEYIDTTSNVENKRRYELVNEIVNELIAQNISRSMHSKGNYIFGSEGKVRESGSTSYEYSFFLIEDFIKKYAKDVINSRKNNNIDIILNKVGKENFDMLSDLFHEFRDNFNDFSFISMKRDLNQNKDTELVRKYKELCDKRDIILGKMEEYTNSKTL